MDVNQLIALWNHAECKVVDVRRTTIGASESVYRYRVPSSLFLISVRGEAEAHVGREVHRMQRVTVLHAGKGAVLDLVAGSAGLDYYSVYYKVVIGAAIPSELAASLEEDRPQDRSYSFAPDNPAALHRIAGEMFRAWGKGSH
ncbi:hypothetical protein [Cohnella rhizosphaerae]|uniref:AraC family transcriptional regulator n=1 Tax=Cohnella rhizosphaerae TaxID=1457232 RepID=A0A9X4QU37_9BACL|nr:hypothetical protein [Cohnella rhizosphaerae]MDG0811330.1 hypothetical protein [Cohnella rhizosphaerae]